jgi:hypothetical protein
LRCQNFKIANRLLQVWVICSKDSSIFFFLFFRKNTRVEFFFELFLSNLNDIRINSLDDFLFRDDAFEIVNRVNCDVVDVLKTSSFNEDLNCSLIFLLLFNHSAKSMIFRVMMRTTLIKNLWLSAQSMNAESFSFLCSKNRAIFCKSCLLDEESLIITEKFELLFTNWKRRWVCRMIWLLRNENFKVKFDKDDIFTLNQKNKAKKANQTT